MVLENCLIFWVLLLLRMCAGRLLKSVKATLVKLLSAKMFGSWIELSERRLKGDAVCSESLRCDGKFWW